jgi:hypothetical protein
MKINPVVVKSILLAVAAAILLALPGLKLPYLDEKADDYFSDAMTGAGLAYGVCRVVNASVSVIKESQIQIEPAGLGVSLAAGQVLDPLDDMTERASDILITAIISLGIQKIAYELCVEFAPALIALAAAVLAASLFFRGDRGRRMQALTLKIIIILAAARLCLPISAVISSCLDDHYFSPRITKIKNELTMNSPEMERLKDMRMPEVDGFIGTVKSGTNFLNEKMTDLGAAFKLLIRNMSVMVSNLLELSYLYVALFLIQVVLLPLGAFWCLARLANTLCGTGIPCILKHRKKEQDHSADNLQ